MHAIVKGGIRQPQPEPAKPIPAADAMCNSALSFAELLELHMRHGTGCPSNRPWTDRSLRAALGSLASLHAIAAWRDGRAVPSRTVFDLLVTRFTLSCHSSSSRPYGSNGAQGAPTPRTSPIRALAIDFEWQEALHAAWQKGQAAQEAALALPEAWEMQARMEAVWWLCRRGQTMDAVGARFKISGVRIQQLLKQREDLFRHEAKTLRPLAALLLSMT